MNDPELSHYFDLAHINNEIIISLFNSQEEKIEELKQEVSKQKKEFENYKKNYKTKLVNVLYIIPPKKYINTREAYADPFDIDFIHKLNNKDIFINVDTYIEDEIMNTIKSSPNFLESYDVIIFGNGDGGGRYEKINYIFNNDLGFIKTGNNNPWYTYSKCSFNPPEWIKNNDGYRITDLMSFPYKIGQNQKFDVTTTHETTIYNSKYKIIESSENSIYYYYSENPEKRIADCSMGHDNNLNENEKKLLFNIIYHLSQLP